MAVDVSKLNLETDAFVTTSPTPLTVQEGCLLSIAVSLKRIADAVEGTPHTPSLVDAIANAISTGMFHGFQNKT